MWVVVVIVVFFLIWVTKKQFPLFVISLARASERKTQIKNMLRGVDYTIFEAVDGKSLTHKQLDLKEKYFGKTTDLSSGQIGMMLQGKEGK